MVLSAGVFAGWTMIGSYVYLFDEYDDVEYTWGACNRRRHLRTDACLDTIERTRRRASSAMFVSFGASLGGAVGPIEDGTDVFAGRYPNVGLPHARWS